MMTRTFDLQYFGRLNYYFNLFSDTHIEFEQYDFQHKMSFRNRTNILGANGVIKLTVPLAGGRDQRTITKDLRIDNNGDWRRRHSRAITSAYNRSPFFEFYRDDLLDLYEQSFEYLVDWNLACFGWLSKILRRPASFSLTEKYQDILPVDCIDYRGKFGPREPFGESFADLTYRQVFSFPEGFVAGLSILDPLFCVGPERVNAYLALDINQE